MKKFSIQWIYLVSQVTGFLQHFRRFQCVKNPAAAISKDPLSEPSLTWVNSRNAASQYGKQTSEPDKRINDLSHTAII